MGSGIRSYPELARAVGRIAANQGYHLLTGGGGGVMEEASRAFCETSPRRGLCLGILKGKTHPHPEKGLPRLVYSSSPANDWVEIPIYTHLPLSGSQGRDEASRNHINVLSSDVLVALPGGSGTYSEVTLRIDYGRRLFLFLGGHKINGHSAEHFVSMAQYRAQVTIAGTSEELEQLLRQQLEE